MHTNESHAGGESTVVEASDFTATCLQLMDRVAETGEEIVITRNGRPVARLVQSATAAHT